MGIYPDMIGLVVENMAASLAFYRLLDLNTPTDQDDQDFVQVITPNGYRISWNTATMIKTFDETWQKPVGQGISLAFHCGTPAGVDETYRRIIEAGYQGHKEPWDAFWGQRYAIVVDPDGYHVELFAPLS
jgi:uncharacterized glyoxalase superfamily protein PhnB